MNLLSLPTIAALLAKGVNPQAPQSQPMVGDPQMPQAAPRPEPQQPDIEVNSPQSQYRDGLVRGGTFRRGGLGGNILGALGDAFLVQGGADPQYAPKLMAARESEALKGFQSEPNDAIARLTQVNPKAGTDLYNTYSDNRRMEEFKAAQIKKLQGDYDNDTTAHVTNMLGAATAQSYPALRQIAMAYAAKRGTQLPFDLPETFDQAQIQGLRMSGVNTDKQIALDDNRSYRDQLLDERRTNDSNRNNYYNGRLTETARNHRALEGIGNRNADTKATGVSKAPDRSKWTQPVSRGSVAPGAAKKPVWDAAKQKYVMQ